MTRIRLKDVVVTNRRTLPETTDPDLTFRYIDISAVSTGSITVPADDTRFETAPSRARRLAEPGDVVVSTVRTYLKAVARVPKSSHRLVFSTGFAVLHPDRERLDSRYLGYFCESAPFIDSIVARSVGVSYPAINASEVADMPVDLPPLEEQRRIADFLDTETTRLDRIADRRLRQLEHLAERRWSHFESLVVEAGATPIPVRRTLRRLTDGPFGSAFSSDDYTTEGAVVVRLGNIGFAEYRAESQARIPIALFEQLKRHRVHDGDLLIAGLGDAVNHAGRACVAPDLGVAIVKGKCFAATVDNAVADAKYLALLFSSPIGRSTFETRGSTRQMINLEIVRSALIPLPSLPVQGTIVEESLKTEQLRTAAAASITRSVELVRERRRALITAAVTGELDVTTARGVSA